MTHAQETCARNNLHKKLVQVDFAQETCTSDMNFHQNLNFLYRFLERVFGVYVTRDCLPGVRVLDKVEQFFMSVKTVQTY